MLLLNMECMKDERGPLLLGKEKMHEDARNIEE